MSPTIFIFTIPTRISHKNASIVTGVTAYDTYYQPAIFPEIGSHAFMINGTTVKPKTFTRYEKCRSMYYYDTHILMNDSNTTGLLFLFL